MKMRELSDSALAQVSAAAERVLEQVGVKVENASIRAMAKNAGAIVDGDIVRFSPKLSRELFAKAPSRYTISGMNGTSYEIGGENQYMTAIVTDPFIGDYPTGIARRPSLDDVVRNTKIIGSRPDVAVVSRMDFPVTDFAGPDSTYRSLEAHLLNHDKAYAVYPTSYESFMEWMELAPILSRGRALKDSGLYTVAIPILSPLVLTSCNCDILLECIKYNFPMVPTVCPMAGSTSPYTVEGTFVQSLAEVMAMFAIVQAVNPGNPCLFAFGPSVMHMQTGHDLYYTMDKVLWKLASVEYGLSLGLPCAAEVGGTTNMSYDTQAGAEGMLMALSAVNSGAHLLAGAGSCYNANGLSSEYILMCYSYIDAARYLTRGMPLDTIDAAIDSIKEQQPGGNFLMDELTLEYMRNSRFFSSPLFDTAAEFGTPKPMLMRAHEQVERIVQEYKSPVPGDTQEAIRRHFSGIYAKL